jgi:hypothetical protein
MREKILPPASKPYFPMILANGSDVVLVDYSGSMHCDSGHCHMEQHMDTHCGWQKTSHREKNRRLVSVAFFPYRVMRPDDDVYEVGWFDQKFDPRTATLVTEARTHILHLRITCFLMDGQPLYAERMEVLWIDPEAQPKIALMAKQMAPPGTGEVSFGSDGNGQVTGQYSRDEVVGSLRMAVKAEGKEIKDISQPHSGYLEVRDLKPGDVIDRFVTMQDTSHTEHPEGDCSKTIDQALAEGFERLHEDHANAWQSYHANTQVVLPDPALDYHYRLSLYLMRASQHPNGFVTHGVYDVLWGGGAACTWDIMMFQRAWASGNQKGSAQALIDFYQHGATPYAREYAKQLDRPGVNYPWFMNVFGRDLFFDNAVDARGVQKWNMCCMALQFYDVFRFFGDVDDLRKRMPILKDTLDFLLAEIVVREDDRWYIGGIEGSDENIDRVNDTAHILSLVKALNDYQEGCRILELPENPDYAVAIERLSVGLAENYHDGILYPWQDAPEVSGTNATYYCLNVPEGINAKSLRVAHRLDAGEWGLDNNNGGRYPNLDWPWQEATVAIAFSSVDPKLAFRWLRHSLSVTDMHGFYPEKIRPDGFWIFIGYGTPHATSVWGLNSLLATDNVKRLTIAAGLPRTWQDYSFADIRTPSGFSVSVEVQDGRLRRLVINNTRRESRRIRLRLLPGGHRDHRDEPLVLLPGPNVIV